jgi:hypothetical protein
LVEAAGIEPATIWSKKTPETAHNLLQPLRDDGMGIEVVAG